MSQWKTIKRLIKGHPNFVSIRQRIIRVLNRRYRKKHVAMLHLGRSGSSVLANMLKVHSQIDWAGEIFEEYLNSDAETGTEDFMNNTINYSRDLRLSTVYGFETKYLPQQHLSTNCLNQSIEGYVAALESLGFTHFIVLHRKNLLRRAVSASVGKATGKWHSNEPIGSPTKIRMDINSFPSGASSMSILESFSSAEDRYERLQRCVAANNKLLLTYEEDIQNDPRIGYRRIIEFLGLSDEAPEIKLRRTNPFAYQEMIENFAEVEAALQGTQHAWMLEH